MAVIGRGRRGGRAHRVRVAQLPPAQRLGTRRHVVCMARGLECREHLQCARRACSTLLDGGVRPGAPRASERGAHKLIMGARAATKGG
eukprot:351129-Chlamydomonas_euryale.AAC.2